MFSTYHRSYPEQCSQHGLAMVAKILVNSCVIDVGWLPMKGAGAQHPDHSRQLTSLLHHCWSNAWCFNGESLFLPGQGKATDQSCEFKAKMPVEQAQSLLPSSVATEGFMTIRVQRQSYAVSTYLAFSRTQNLHSYQKASYIFKLLVV